MLLDLNSRTMSPVHLNEEDILALGTIGRLDDTLGKDE